MVNIELNTRNVLLGALYLLIAFWLVVGTVGFLAQKHTTDVYNTLCPPMQVLQGAVTPGGYQDASYSVTCSYDMFGSLEIPPRFPAERPILKFIFAPINLLTGSTCASGFGSKPMVFEQNGVLVVGGRCTLLPPWLQVPGVDF